MAGFMDSPQYVYNTVTHDGVLKEWTKKDFPTMLSPLTKIGYSWDATTSRMEIVGNKFGFGLNFATPWSHAYQAPEKHCGFDHHILFNTWRIIHPRCLRCWKVVVTPNTFHQLMQLEELQNQMGVAAKCGIELRDYTPKFYGGYFYTNSLDEGRARYEQVRKAVDEHIDGGKELSVILKRGCTEYEFVKGPSPFWHNTAEEEEMIDIVDAHVNTARSNSQQSAMVKNNVRLKWVLWAHANGDMSYKQYNNGKSIFPDYVSYHEGDIDEIKRDLAVAQAKAINGFDDETTDEFLELCQKFVERKNILNIGQLSTMLGPSQNETNIKFRKYHVAKDIPEQNKGDDDQST